MTQQHPITPSPELVAKLWREASAGRDDAPIGEIFNHGVYLAYQAGADQELEACCEWFVRDWTDIETADKLRAARRPKPLNRKEQALEAIGRLCASVIHDDLKDDAAIVRRALESLDD